jgi:hypothetical protein
MIDHATRRKDGAWGVSHNSEGVILKVISYTDCDRILLCGEEVDEVIESLKEHRDKALRGDGPGAWGGMGGRTSISTE